MIENWIWMSPVSDFCESNKIDLLDELELDKTSQSIIYFMLKSFHQIRLTVSKIYVLICGQYGLELLSNRWSQFSGHLLSDENSKGQ